MWSMFGYHYPLLLINFRLSQRHCNHCVLIFKKGHFPTFYEVIKDDCLINLSRAIDLILEDWREDALRGIPTDATREMFSVG